MAKHNISLNPRSSRSSHKSGIFERNNGVFKSIMEKLQRADKNATPETSIARTSFLSNLTKGYKCISSFQMAKGFSPSILGIPMEVLSNETIKSHIDKESIRAIERIMKSNTPKTTDPALMVPRSSVLFLGKASNKVNPIRGSERKYRRRMNTFSRAKYV